MSEQHSFQAEISELLNLIINSLYSKKDISVRELISNSSDSLNKLRYASLTDNQVLKSESELFIKLIPNKDDNTLTVWDSGEGMTKESLVENLGTIAKSGTKEFVKAALDSKDKDNNMIGQFGVGFYSSFLIADIVDVYSKHCESDKVYKWSSDAKSTFTIDEVDDMDLPRGTKIVLHLKDDCTEFLEDSKLRDLVLRHSQFTEFPIFVQMTKTREEEVEQEVVQENTDVAAKAETKDEVEADVKDIKVEDVEDVDSDDEENKPETETRTVEYTEFDRINNQKPLWLRTPDNVTEDEHKAFYKSMTSDWDDYLTLTHFAMEGAYRFKMLMYVPKSSPHDALDRNKDSIDFKLYVKRVFITDKCKEVVPEWLSFIKGVVDSDDLPLNVSREILQDSQILRTMKKQFTKKAISMFEDLQSNEDQYTKFYAQYSKNIKLGIHEDSVNREKLVNLLRFTSINHPNGDLSPDTYVNEMKDNQNELYFITGTELKEIENSPFLEGLKKQGYDVLLLFDPIDEYMMQQVTEFKEKKFRNVTKEGLKLNEDQEDTENYTELHKYVKECLEGKVEKVSTSTTLYESPCALSSSQYGWSANMQNLMKAQTMGNNQMASLMADKKVLELNVNHKLIKHLTEKVKSQSTDKATKSLVEMLYETSLLTSGFGLESSHEYAKKVHNMLCLGFSIDQDEDEDEDDNENVSMTATVDKDLLSEDELSEEDDVSDDEVTSNDEVEVKTEKTVKVKKNINVTSKETNGIDNPDLETVSDKNVASEGNMEQVE